VLDACNVCDADLHRRVIDGDLRAMAREVAEPARLICEHQGCGSRPRQRTFRILLDEHVAHRRQRSTDELVAAEIDGSAVTRRMLRPLFGRLDDLGRGEAAIDPRTLDGVGDGSVHFLAIPRSLERIVELGEVFDSARRVLATNGLLAFSIDEPRIRPGIAEPTRPGEGRIAVGLSWLLSALAERGFEASYLRLDDPFSGAPAPWFLARKLER
jgi:hypothetical protein